MKKEALMTYFYIAWHGKTLLKDMAQTALFKN